MRKFSMLFLLSLVLCSCADPELATYRYPTRVVEDNGREVQRVYEPVVQPVIVQHPPVYPVTQPVVQPIVQPTFRFSTSTSTYKAPKPQTVVVKQKITVKYSSPTKSIGQTSSTSSKTSTKKYVFTKNQKKK